MRPLDSHTIARLTAAFEEMDDFVFLETVRLSAENHRSFLFTRPLCLLDCTLEDDPLLFLQRAEAYLGKGYFLAGWFGYEFGRQLEPVLHAATGPGSQNAVTARLGVYQKQFVFDHASEQFTGGSAWPLRTPNLEQCSVTGLQTNISRQEFLSGIEAIKKYILAGDTYQVNYTFKLDFAFSGSKATLYRQLRNNQSVAYGAWMRFGGQDVMSFSPELFFAAGGDRIHVRPMKGTLSRGRDTDQDRIRAEQLCTDAKSRSENVMIVDLLRNDLARLLHDCCPGGGQVRVESLFDVESYESLLQMTSSIVGFPQQRRLPKLSEILHTLFPCGSVTGAPKIRTMEIIHELEKEPRGVYCGAIGYCSSDEMCFNVPIRTLTLNEDKGSMGIGAGIVHDSDPESEWRECLLKGRFLTHPRPEFQLIETLCWQPGRGYLLLQEHLDRLKASSDYFFFQIDLDQVTRSLLAENDRFAEDGMRVRMVLFKDGRVEISSSLLAPATPGDELPQVVFSSQRVDTEDVFFYHKTTCRELYEAEREDAVKRGVYEMLFINTKGEVTEGTISTLFVEMDGKLYTPPVSCGLLPGTFRRSYLDAGKAEERILTMDDLHAADSLYVANSVRGLVQVELAGKE